MRHVGFLIMPIYSILQRTTYTTDWTRAYMPITPASIIIFTLKLRDKSQTFDFTSVRRVHGRQVRPFPGGRSVRSDHDLSPGSRIQYFCIIVLRIAYKIEWKHKNKVYFMLLLSSGTRCPLESVNISGVHWGDTNFRQYHIFGPCG
jgi:hypothetical protein